MRRGVREGGGGGGGGRERANRRRRANGPARTHLQVELLLLLHGEVLRLLLQLLQLHLVLLLQLLDVRREVHELALALHLLELLRRHAGGRAELHLLLVVQLRLRELLLLLLLLLVLLVQLLLLVLVLHLLVLQLLVLLLLLVLVLHVLRVRLVRLLQRVLRLLKHLRLRLRLRHRLLAAGGRELLRAHLLERGQAVDLDAVARREEGVELEDQVLVVLEELGHARDHLGRRDAVLAELAHDLPAGRVGRAQSAATLARDGREEGRGQRAGADVGQDKTAEKRKGQERQRWTLLQR